MTLLKDNNYKDINIALLSLEADIKKLGNNSSITSQLADINKRIDEINKDSGGSIDEIKADVKNLKNDVIAINSDIYNIENDVATINNDITSINNDITTINSDITNINTNIDNIEQQLSNIFSAENKVTDFNATTDSGIYYWIDDAANRPGTDYGVLLVNKFDSGSGSLWINQIAYGCNGRIYFRQKINNNSWREWKAIAFDGEINADTVDNYHASQLWRSDGATWNPSANVVMTPSGNGDEWSFDFRNKNGKTGNYWQVWDENKQTLLKVDADSGKVSAPYGFVGNLSGKADTADYSLRMKDRTIDLSAQSPSNFYPVFFVTGDDFAEVAVHSPNLRGSAAYNQNRIHFDISTNGWADTPRTLNIREYACYENSEITIGCIGVGTQTGGWAIWLRGGMNYIMYTRNATPSLKTANYTHGTEIYTVGTNYYGGSNTNVSIMFTPQSTIKDGAYSSREITATEIKANNRMRIPIGAPSTKENGCIWIG